jgi:hypothetical protein
VFGEDRDNTKHKTHGVMISIDQVLCVIDRTMTSNIVLSLT